MRDEATPAGEVDQYIAGFPEDVREILQRIRAIIREEAPDAQETIKYRMPTYVLRGNLVHYAAYAHHIGLYPTPSGIEAFATELAEYQGGKGSARLPLDRPMPYDLIRRIVAYRVQEALHPAYAKGKKVL